MPTSRATTTRAQSTRWPYQNMRPKRAAAVSQYAGYADGRLDWLPGGPAR